MEGGETVMAVLAKPAKKVRVMLVNDKKSFVEQFNKSLPSKEKLEVVEKAGKLFKWAKRA